MKNYDLLVLSSNEFENLTRDLMQNKLGVFIESFTAGRDGGIDLRCAKDKNNKVIIQAKRYKDLSDLMSVLRKEVVKVASLKPDRYIISTTVGLSPNNKSDILKLFSPYILSTEDILGNDDVNNLIGVYEAVELKYYKLWLASTSIVDKIVHSRIYNQSSFELENIKEKVRLYVQNDSFNTGLQILNEHRYVIISGIPGIGKTTLARILTLYLLSKEFEEFVYLTDSINDGYEFYREGKKQIFFFDDFLGRNFFESKLAPKEDDKLIRFIEKIKKSPDKLLILATREYILNQAKSSFEAFKINNIEIAKCVLDLASYTNLVKAQILYNHLFFAGIPQKYLEDLVNPDNHLELVKHPNYNPRVIETIINRKIWNSCEPSEFSMAIKSYFDNPESVWLHAFENSLDKFSQYILLVLLTMGTPVKIECLEKGLIAFLKINQYKFQIAFDSIAFIRSLRELENTFILTQKDSFTSISIEYQNPSIQDFLVNYLRGKKDLILSLIKSSCFQEQIFAVFTSNDANSYSVDKKILLDKEMCDASCEVVKSKYDSLETCRVTRLRFSESENFSWYVDKDNKYRFMARILAELKVCHHDIVHFVYEKFLNTIYLDSTSYSEQSAYLKLLSDLGIESSVVDDNKLVRSFLGNVLWIDNLELFSKIESLFPVAYKQSIEEPDFDEKFIELIKEGVDNMSESDMGSVRNQVELMGLEYGFDLSNYLGEIDERIKDYNEYLESQADSYVDSGGRYGSDRQGVSENAVIQEVFKGLAAT